LTSADGVKVDKTAEYVDDAANNSSDHLSTNGENLKKSLASQQQMGETGRTIIGPGKLVDAQRLSQQYGGNPLDWVKKTSSSFLSNGVKFETHWYENISTGMKVEFKTKF